MKLEIGLDYDNTFTADPDLWRSFINSCQERGHRVWIVTARRQADHNHDDMNTPDGIPVVFTEMASKVWFMKERRGVEIDIWIDDDPLTCAQGH